MRGPRARWAVRDLRALLRAWIVEDPGLKALSLVLALGAWWWVQGQQVATEPLRIVLDWRLPAELVPTTSLPTAATAIVQGPRSAIRRARLLRPTIVADLSDEGQGTQDVRLASYGIERLPPTLSVVTFTPEILALRLDKKVTRKVVVEPVTVGSPAERHTVDTVSLEPDVVELVGAREVVVGLRSVRTTALDVTGWTEGRTVPVGLELPAGVGTSVPWAGKVTVGVTSLVGEQTIQGVPVMVWGAPGWRPADGMETLTVTLRGPTEILRAMRVDHVVARVEVPAATERNRLTATFQAAEAPRLEILLPRPDVVEVLGRPGPVDVERR